MIKLHLLLIFASLTALGVPTNYNSKPEKVEHHIEKVYPVGSFEYEHKRTI